MSSQGLPSTQPSNAPPLLPRLSPHWGLTRVGHTPGRGAVSRPLSSPPSPSPPRLPWSAPSTPSCSQSFCPGDAKAGPPQEEDQRDRGRGVSGREGKRGSPGVWLPSLPSPEEALENTDNKNSCSPAKRKCHFYPGLVLGTTGATSPMGSGAGSSSGQEAGLRSTACIPRPKGKGYEGPTGASAQNPAMGSKGGIDSSPAGAKGGRQMEWAPERLAAQALTQGLPGNAARLALPAQSRYRRGLGVPVWAGPDSKPHPALSRGVSLARSLPPSSTTALGFSPSLGTPGSSCQARGHSSGQNSAQLGLGARSAPGLGEQRV